MEKTPETSESEQLKKLRKEIINEGINKKSYSSAEEESDNDDSDNDILMKFKLKKNKNGKQEFDSIGYAFLLNNKLSRIRSELARTEERLRYSQLDNSNKELEIESLMEKNTKCINLLTNKTATLKSNELTIITNSINLGFYKVILAMSVFINIIYYTNVI